MDEERNELKRVDWPEVFSFTRVFKSFRLALNLSNLILGLAAILLICIAGWVMDGGASLGGQRVMVGEVASFSALPGDQFATIKANWEKDRPARVAELKATVVREKQDLSDFINHLDRSDASGRHFLAAFREIVSDASEVVNRTTPDVSQYLEAAEDDWSEVLSDAKDTSAARFNRIAEVIETASETAKSAIKADPGLANKDKKNRALARLDDDRAIAVRSLTATRMDFNSQVEAICGQKISDSFIAYEGDCLKNYHSDRPGPEDHPRHQ